MLKNDGVHFLQPFRLQTLYVFLEPLAPTDLWTCEACDRHDIRIGLLGRCIIVSFFKASKACQRLDDCVKSINIDIRCIRRSIR